MYNVNLLINGGFEDSSLTDWIAHGLTASSTTTTKKSGVKSVQLTPSATWNFYEQIIPNINHREFEGKTLSFSCYIKGSATGVRIAIKKYSDTSSHNISAGSGVVITMDNGSSMFSVGDVIFIEDSSNHEWRTVEAVDTGNSTITCSLSYSYDNPDIYILAVSSASSSTDTWEQLTVTATLPTSPMQETSIGKYGYGVWITPNASTGTFYIDEAMVVIGDTAVNYEPVSLASYKVMNTRPLEWVSNTEVKISATSDVSAKFLASGLYGGKDLGYVICGDGRVMSNTSADTMNMPSDLDTGSEASSNWYTIMACDDGSGGFILKAVTFIRVKDDNSSIISCGTHLDANTAKDYSWSNDDYNGKQFLVLTGTYKGTVRTVSDTYVLYGSSILTYSGGAIGLSRGDWIMIAPKGYSNFRYVGSIFNGSDGHIMAFNSHDGQYYFNPVLIANAALASSGVVRTGYAAISPLAFQVNYVIELSAGIVSVGCNLIAGTNSHILNGTRQDGISPCDVQSVYTNGDGNPATGNLWISGYKE